MAVNTQKFLPGSTGTQKALPQAKTSSITLTPSDKKGSDIIHVKTIQIAKLLKGTLAADKKKLTDKKKEASQERKQDAETKLEKKPDPKKKLMMPKVLPKMGFLDWIKNYIGNILLGYFAVRMVDHLPTLMEAFKGIVAVGEFIINIGGDLLNGLVSFIDWGDQAYEATRGFIKTIGGESFLGAFDKFSGVVGTVIETLIMTSIALASQGDQVMDIAGDFVGDWMKKRAAQQVVQQGVTTATSSATTTASTAGTATGIGAAATAAVVAGAGLLASALGEGAFQLRKIAQGPIEETQKKFDKANWLDPRKYFYGATLVGQKMLLGPIAALGFILDIIGAPFRYAIELLRMPFLDEEGKKKQAHNLAKFDARIREDFRKGLNMLTLGFAFKEKGQFGNIYGNKAAQTEMMSKMASGGKTGRRKRVKRRKKPVMRRIMSSQLNPGSAVGGKKKIDKLIPNTDNPPGKIRDERAWWDPMGIFGTGKDDEKPKTTIKKPADPMGYVEKVYSNVSDTKFFGPIMSIAVKTVAGEKATNLDYRNIGIGLNNWMYSTFGDAVQAHAEGGEVRANAFLGGKNLTKVIEKSVKGTVDHALDSSITDLKKELNRADLGGDTDGSYESSDQPGDQGGFGPRGYMIGPAGTSGDKLTMARNLMRDLGLTEAQAAGIVGNMAAESGVENGRPQGSRPGVKAPLVVDGKTGYGLVQWTSQGRQQRLWDFAKSKGYDMSKPLSMDIEYQFFLKEFQGRYAPVLKQIRKAKNVKSASTIFMQQYEIPAGYRTEAKIMERYNMSQPIYEKLSSGQGTATEGAGQFIPSEGQTPSQSKGTKAGSVSVSNYGFAMRPAIPGLTARDWHMGQDVSASPTNSQLIAFNPGIIQDVNWHSGYGNYINWKDTKTGLYNFYAHMQQSARGNFRAGQSVAAGTVLGLQGTTGTSTGPHLHWEVSTTPGGGGREKMPIRGRGPNRKDAVGRLAPLSKYDSKAPFGFALGGFTKSGAHEALLGEKGREFVMDADSTAAIEKTFPGLLSKLNRSTYHTTISTLRNYAEYEFGSRQEVVVEPEIITVPIPMPGSGGGGILPTGTATGTDPAAELNR